MEVGDLPWRRNGWEGGRKPGRGEQLGEQKTEG